MNAIPEIENNTNVYVVDGLSIETYVWKNMEDDMNPENTKMLFSLCEYVFNKDWFLTMEEAVKERANRVSKLSYKGKN